MADWQRSLLRNIFESYQSLEWIGIRRFSTIVGLVILPVPDRYSWVCAGKALHNLSRGAIPRGRSLREEEVNAQAGRRGGARGELIVPPQFLATLRLGDFALTPCSSGQRFANQEVGKRCPGRKTPRTLERPRSSGEQA